LLPLFFQRAYQPTEQVKQKLVIWQLANCGEGTKEKAIVYVKTLGVKEA